MRLILTFAAATALLLATTGSAAAKAPRDFVGVVAEDVIAGTPAYRAATLKRQRKLGIQVIRQTFDWTVIEGSKGHFDFAYYDRLVGDAARSRIRIVPILFNPPGWRAKAPQGSYRYPPRKTKHMKVFGKKIARRYGRRGSFWRQNRGVPKRAFTRYQIWNEPNLPIYWPKRPKARQYVRLVKAARKGIKRVDRRAEIVTGGMPDSKYPGSVPLIKYIKQLYKAGGKKAFDTIAINTYAENSKQLIGLLRKVRKVMNRKGDRKGKIWASEFGWATQGPKSRFTIGPKAQARNVAKSIKAMGRNRKRLKLTGFVYWNWKDAPPYNFDFWGLHAGLLNIDGTPKPGLNSFAEAVKKLR